MRPGDDLRGGDGLTRVALGVVGTVDEEAADGGGQGTASHGAGLVEVGDGEGADTQEGGVEALVEFGEQCGFRGIGVELGAESFELGGAELVAFGVGEEAIEAARDVAEVKGEGCDLRGAGVERGAGERSAGGIDVLAGEIEGVDNGAEDSGEIGVGAAEPGFGLGHKDIVGAGGARVEVDAGF